MSWAESVNRVLALRRLERLEADRAELIRIIQRMEREFAVVVNRRVHEALRDVPSWKDPQPEAVCAPRVARVGGMTTWADKRKRLEKRLSAKTEKFRKRVDEIRGVLGEGLGPMPATPEETQPRAAVPHENSEGDGDVETGSV